MEQIKELFYENPQKSFYLSQIARLTDTPKTTVLRYLNKLEKEKKIIRENTEPFPNYIANIQNPFYILQKKQYIIRKIFRSGLIDYLLLNLQPDCIILFGSMQKGNYDKDSDIDLFIGFPEKKIDLKRFERKLMHKIHIQWGDIRKLPDALANSINNGDRLYGLTRFDGLGKVQKKARKKRRTRDKKDRMPHKSSKNKT